MRWFGKSWGAAVCDSDNHTPTPVGIACLRCKRPIQRGDQGVTMYCTDADDQGEPVVSTVAEHLRCFLASLVCPGCEHCQPKRAERAEKQKHETDTRLN